MAKNKGDNKNQNNGKNVKGSTDMQNSNESGRQGVNKKEPNSKGGTSGTEYQG